MAEIRFNIVFNGELVNGFEQQRVKKQFSQLFKLDDARVDQMFKASSCTLKKGLDETGAKRYQEKLQKIGVKVSLKPIISDQQLKLEPMESKKPDISADDISADKSADEIPASNETEIGTFAFEFTGNGFEYFRIWIVNIFLSIITLGIYSAWAKVRNNQYFYSNTRLCGSTFVYLAKPISILKGRVIALVLFGIYTVVAQLQPIAGSVMILVFVLLVPWLVVRSLAFRARNTAYRNIRFGFDGSTWDAAKTFVLWPLAGVLTLGLLIPYTLYKKNLLIIDYSMYGKTRFQFNATVGAYYKYYLIAFAIFLAGGLVAGAAAALVPPLALIAPLPFYLFGFAFIMTHIENLIYNETVLGEHQFESCLEVKTMAFIFFTNIIAVTLSLGLMIPWARVRLARYRAACLQLVASENLDGFVASEKKQVSAIGEEIGDIFDVDVGL